MSFDAELQAWPPARIDALLADVTSADVAAALRRSCPRTPRDLAAMLSEHAPPQLEAMALEGQRLSRWHFGRTIGLYVPLYLSNVCGADCVYCGYAVRSGAKDKARLNLRPEEIRREAQVLASQGFQDVLLLTGEAPRAVSVSDIAAAVDLVRETFPSVSVEIYALDADGYEVLAAHGVEGVTLYMETYHRETYAQVHLLGQKRDFGYRLDALERAGRAGIRNLSLGALLGLYNWRHEAFWLGLHGRYLQKACWRSQISVSFPRLRHVPERFAIPEIVTDRELVQLMLALRLFLPEAGFNLSTREHPTLRDHLVPLGVTRMSAGSSTRPGGYATHDEETLEQFAIEDARSASEVAQAIRAAGYEPVWKDFDHAFLGQPTD